MDIEDGTPTGVGCQQQDADLSQDRAGQRRFEPRPDVSGSARTAPQEPPTVWQFKFKRPSVTAPDGEAIPSCLDNRAQVGCTPSAGSPSGPQNAHCETDLPSPVYGNTGLTSSSSPPAPPGPLGSKPSRSGPQDAPGSGLLAKRLGTLQARKLRSREFFNYLSEYDVVRAKKGLRCGSWLWFRDFFTHPERPIKLWAGNFCQQNHYCDFCSALKAARTYRRNVPKVLAILANTSLKPYLLTLTCEHMHDLAAMVQHLLGAWSAAIERRRNQAKGQRATVFSDLEGGIVAFETKRGRGSGNWNFHAHAIVVSCHRDICEWSAGFLNADGTRGKWFAATEFRQEWARLLGQETANINIKPLRTADPRRPEENNLTHDLLEVFKYALKTGEMSHADHYHAAEVLHGRHLLRSFGCFVGLKLKDSVITESDELTRLEGWPSRDLVYRFLDNSYQLAQVTELDNAKKNQTQWNSSNNVLPLEQRAKQWQKKQRKKTR